MILLLFGPPGCGKGTQARLLSQWFSVPAVSTGDLLRAEAESGSEFGNQLAATLAAGKYVSDETVNQLIVNRLDRLDGGGIILDGYPRTVEQARFLDEALRARAIGPAVAVYLRVPTDVIVRRLSSRSQCSNCRRVYSQGQETAPYCVECGAPLFRRSDDEPEVVLKRMETYRDKTSPVLAHYGQQCYHEVDGDRNPDTVFDEIVQRLNSVNGGPH
ncbi:MAG: nucleoside monophosphate kinase [Bryobacteraceae bacterium]